MQQRVALPLALRDHPLRRPRILVPVLALLFAVHLPFLHAWLRGPAEVTAAVPFRDDFERATLGEAYWSNGGHWRIARGQVYSPGVGNNPLWLKARLPRDVRIEFDVRSEKLDEPAPTESELRAQLANLAQPYARKLEGLEALWERLRGPFVRSSARADLDRLEKGTYYQPDTPRVVKRLDLKVERGRTYHETVTRRGGLIRWEQDGQLVLEMNDGAPLPIEGHDRFGFSSWQNDTYFDNLKI